MKDYELAIEPCHTDYEKIYRSKGHHTSEDFIQALKDYGLDPEKYALPERVYIKTTPTHKDSWTSCQYNIVEKGVRGSYPCTYVREKLY